MAQRANVECFIVGTKVLFQPDNLWTIKIKIKMNLELRLFANRESYRQEDSKMEGNEICEWKNICQLFFVIGKHAQLFNS